MVARVRGCESSPRAVVGEVAPAGLPALVVPIGAFLYDAKTLKRRDQYFGRYVLDFVHSGLHLGPVGFNIDTRA